MRWLCAQGKASEASRDREVRAARESECLIVSPHWITAVSLPPTAGTDANTTP